MNRLVALTLLAASAACGRGSGDAVVASSTGVAPGSSSPSVAASASPKPVESPPAAWKGTYKSAVGELAVPADWNKVHWTASDTGAGVGEGSISLTVDATGHVEGTLDGALGPALVEGEVVDGHLSASVRRKNAGDGGFTGTLLGTVSGDHASGTINLANANGGALRDAAFTLKRS